MRGRDGNTGIKVNISILVLFVLFDISSNVHIKCTF